MRSLDFVAAAAAAILSAASAHGAGAVPLRGVVEGYYGRPWGTEGRLSLLKFMGEMDLNVFIYGPKDDPYHHSKWREPYPEAEMRDFAKLIRAAKENGVDFYWAIHLGGGFRKGSEEDYAALFRKLGYMYDGGFRAFAVFFDDFGSADAGFHAEICNRIVAEFLERRGGCAALVMCPNVYAGTGHKYQKALGEKLDRRVHVMWTGRGICSDIRAEDVERITKDLRRAPFVWWNWPVNDYCRSSLLLGRTYGLEKCKLAGLVSNPMENCEASKLALYGLAKWCRDPDGFDSVECWEESFAKLYKDPEVAHAMRVFAEHNSDQGPNGHGYRREESVAAAPLCARARRELDDAGRLSEGTAAELMRLFGEVRLAAKTLKGALPKGRYDLGWEIEGWLDDEMHLMEQGAWAIKGGDLATLDRIRAAAADDARRHCEKFAAATFGADRRNVKSPKASPRELRPLVERLVKAELGRRYRERFGRDFDETVGFAAFSTAKSLEGLQVSRDGRFAGLVRVMEQREVAPGETFGLSVPESWPTDYFHARLGTGDAVEAGAIEISKDGKSWQKLATSNNAEKGEFQTPLDPGAGWRFARYRNTSSRPVRVRIDLFKFDVHGSPSPVDAMLGALLRE